VAEAYALNDPLIVWGVPQKRGGSTQAMAPFLSCNLANIVIETIKQAEDGRGIIVRLYETQRKRGVATLSAAFPVAHAWRTNLLEENQFELEVSEKQVKVPVKPYQIVTVRIVD
jgi:alpha-mannosidase